MELAVVSHYHHLVDLHFLADPDGIVVSELLPFCLFCKAVPRVLELRGGVRSLDGALPEQLHDDFLVWIFVAAMCIGAGALNTRFMRSRSALCEHMLHPKVISHLYELAYLRDRDEFVAHATSSELNHGGIIAISLLRQASLSILAMSVVSTRLLTDGSNHLIMPMLGDNGNTNDKGQDNEISDNDICSGFHGFWLCEHHGNRCSGQ